jgi:hypothetical protein
LAGGYSGKAANDERKDKKSTRRNEIEGRPKIFRRPIASTSFVVKINLPTRWAGKKDGPIAGTAEYNICGKGWILPDQSGAPLSVGMPEYIRQGCKNICRRQCYNANDALDW